MRVWVALCVALFMSTVAISTAAYATVPGTNGKIAFTRTLPQFNEEIFVVNPDGSGEANLTNHPDDDFEPAWSPDGQKIAFISSRDISPRDQYPDLWIMNADGSGPIKLTPDASGVSDIAWYPDGSRILFSGSCGDSGPLCGTFSVSPAGGDATPFTTGLLRHAAWSPYGEPVAYAQYTSSGTPSIRTANREGNGHSVLVPGQGPADILHASMDWSVDGRTILFDGTVSSSEEGSLKLAEWPNGAVSTVPGSLNGDRWPTWSPDGHRLAFIDGSGQLTTMDADGTDRATIPTPGSAAHPDWQTLNPQAVPQGYARPKAAHLTKAFLVPAYFRCTPEMANRTHGPPLEHPSCSAPSQLSEHLTVGTADSNGAPTRFLGSVSFRTLRGDPATAADEADVSIETSLTDVRCRFVDAGYPCTDGELSDYTGDVQVVTTVRITDKPATGPRTGTTQDTPLRINVPCNDTPGDVAGSNCALSTTMDSLMPGAVIEGTRAVWNFGQIEVRDAGVDATIETSADNGLFATQGIFVP